MLQQEKHLDWIGPTPIHFGAFLRMLRDRHGVKQAKVLTHLPSLWTQPFYSKIERGVSAPAFSDLATIYAALKDAGVQLSLRDRQQFLALAKSKLESKKTHRVRELEPAWQELQLKLARIDQLPIDYPTALQPHQARLAPKPRIMETRHLVGREQWLASLMAWLHGTPSPKKLVVLQGSVGIGKTSELHRLGVALLRTVPRAQVILCDLPLVERVTNPEIVLDQMLGNLLAEVGPPDAVPPQASLEVRTAVILRCLQQGTKPVFILLDRAEQMLDEQGKLPQCWEHFLEQFIQWQLPASLIMATKEWRGWFEERLLVGVTIVPSLEPDASVVLLRALGLQAVPLELLQRVHEVACGIPQCLEWFASLVRDPLLVDSWDAINLDEDGVDSAGDILQNTVVQRVQRLLNDPSLFGVGTPVTAKLLPLLDRVLEKQLSPEARLVLFSLAVTNIPIGKRALQAVCPRPSIIQEFRNASLLVASPHRVQLLPMVAAVLRARLSVQQKQELETQLANALMGWLMASQLSLHESGLILTEVAEIFLKHRRLLEAAELLIRHGWLSFGAGHARRLALLAEQAILEEDKQTTPENTCGRILLHYFLCTFLGQTIDDRQRIADYQRVLHLVSVQQVALQPLTETYLTRILMVYTMNDLRFEEAQGLLDTCAERLTWLFSSKPDLLASVLELRALLFARWGEYAEEQGKEEMAQALGEKTLALYRQSVDLLSVPDERMTELKKRSLRKRRARCLANLGYHLNRFGYYEEALDVLEQSITLQENGYVDPGMLAAAYGEKSQVLANLKRYREALAFDEKALSEVQHLADAGDTLSQEEVWIYLVNRGRLYWLMGRAAEAELILRDALRQKSKRRRRYSVLANQILQDIGQHPVSTPFQWDKRWADQFRQLVSFNAFWWLAHAGPFTEEEQRQWDQLFLRREEEKVQKQLESILAQSRQRELTSALDEHREPILRYPAIPIEEVNARISGLLSLDATISQDEQNEIIRRLYHEAIEERICYLRLIRVTYDGENQQFWEFTRQLYPEPTQAEMEYTLSQVKRLLLHGLARPETREVSQQVLQVLRKQYGLFANLQSEHKERRAEPKIMPLSTPQESPVVSAEAAKRFFEAVLAESGYEGWQVILDHNAHGPRIEAASRLLILPDTPLAIVQIKSYLLHELGSHIFRAVAGERSSFGLLGIGTKGYKVAEEGLALYHEIQTAALLGKTFDDSRLWLGTLATGLAAGVCTPPQTFRSLSSFLELFLILYRQLRRPDEDFQTVQKKARELAQALCLRTYRGVPDLTEPGICSTMDVVYLRGFLMIEDAIAQDETILDRLAVGRVALEYLPDLQALGITAQLQPLRKLAHEPNLDAYIASFEQRTDLSTHDANCS
jgi:tetratricopeptide (TPR) repeat protein/transcriptional regulator with XRE-family HTH domain